MKVRYVLIFSGLVILLGTVGYLPFFLESFGYVKWPVVLTVLFIIIGGGSPAFAAVIVTLFEYGKEGPSFLFRQFNPRYVSWVWFVVAVVLPFAIALCVIAFWCLFGHGYCFEAGLLKGLIPLLLSNFAVNMWEEVGWRGYALRTLQMKYGALISTVIVGLVWALWHWPLFFMAGSSIATNYHNNYLLFVSTTLFISVVYSWLYNSSGNNLLVVSLFHAASNTANTVLLAGAGVPFDAAFIYLAVVGVLAVVLILVYRPRYLSRLRTLSDRTSP